MLSYFQNLLHTALSLYWGQECEYVSIYAVPRPDSDWLQQLTEREEPLSFEEQAVLLLAMMPYVSPQSLDLFFMQNKAFGRPYTEFGGWKGTTHGGFLPTGETAVFLLSLGDPEKREKAVAVFSKSHWFHTSNILHLEGEGGGEPFLSGRLALSDDFIARFYKREYQPAFNADFPAKRVTTPLEWNDLVLSYQLHEDLEDISLWLQNEKEIRQRWGLDRIIKPGYRCLFYGPPGTGKTLTAALLGKRHRMDVYRIDLSMIVSKYVGETEKNLAKIFDKAEHHNWILFFDEADSLFGKRTQTNTSNDRYANQEVSFLLQRIEDFPGTIILATNMKENIDEAFLRRFQSVLYYPIPDEKLRFQLWKNMLPDSWLPDPADKFLHSAAEHALSGGSMVNVVQNCAIRLYQSQKTTLPLEMLKEAINKELFKEGKMVKL